MLIIDGTQYSKWDRDLFEQMRRGGVSAVNVTLVYWENARETLSVIAAWNRRFADHTDLIMPIRRMHDLQTARARGRTGILFGLQNCSPIEDELGLVEVFADLGVRTMQLTYNNQSLLATGCYESSDAGITRFGREVIREMNRVGMVIDMSHSAERSTLEAIDLSAHPIVISHANPLDFHPSKRNKSAAVLRARAGRGGLLGLSLYPFHLKDGSACSLETFSAMAARTAEQIGIDHVAIGSDLCQNQPYAVLEWMRTGRWAKQADFGEGSAANRDWPEALGWFGGNADFPTLVRGLQAQGLSDSDVRKIMGENWLRILSDAERIGDARRDR